MNEHVNDNEFNETVNRIAQNMAISQSSTFSSINISNESYQQYWIKCKTIECISWEIFPSCRKSYHCTKCRTKSHRATMTSISKFANYRYLTEDEKKLRTHSLQKQIRLQQSKIHRMTAKMNSLFSNDNVSKYVMLL
jgi:hypothetical protein